MMPASFIFCALALSATLSVFWANADDPTLNFEWIVTYGTISPLGVPQRGILINGQFPGPTVNCVSNDNIVVNVINKLDEPLLITWNGVQQRKNSWQDGVLGTNCPILPNKKWTYHMQMKDQIGTYTYYPSTLMHRAAGGFGAFNIHRRSVVPLPYMEPDGEFNLLVGDWFKADHKVLEQILSSGKPLPFPDGLLINGHPKSYLFTGEGGKTYLFRVSNVGLMTSINFRIQNHTLKLVEVEGSHTIQNVYDKVDIHVGQSMAFLVTLNKTVKDYYIVVSSRFTSTILISTATLRYEGSRMLASGPLPGGPTYQIDWSMRQARTIRWNLTANAARPNPQGSFHYGAIAANRTLILGNSATNINGKLRYAVNSVSYFNPDTPLKLADYFNITGVFNLSTITDKPMPQPAILGTSVINMSLHEFTEIIFQNSENTIQSWHLDGAAFWTVGYGYNQWNPGMRKRYNKVDAVSRHTVQVYPNSWSAVLASLDNKGLWNLRSAIWPRQYLGSQLYLRVWDDVQSLLTEYPPPDNVLLCGKALRS
ncbi:hypothetical protein Drorol1_Dr00010684 [Drosera rotundifolia]